MTTERETKIKALILEGLPRLLEPDNLNTIVAGALYDIVYEQLPDVRGDEIETAAYAINHGNQRSNRHD
jgi:hypothetical protein